MANVIRIDRRAPHFLENKVRAIERAMDIEALAQEQYRDLEQMHEAFWRNDGTAFLRAVTNANEKRIAIRVIAQATAQHIESADVWTRSDGAVATEAATAA